MLLIIFSYIADLVFGDPEWFPHPVREIGKLINFLRDYVLIIGKKIIRPDSKTPRRFLRNLLAAIGIIRTAIPLPRDYVLIRRHRG